VKTTAQKIADHYKNDGQLFTVGEEDIFNTAKTLSTDSFEHNTGYSIYKKFIFEDDSSLIFYGDCWDIGLNPNPNDFRANANEFDLIINEDEARNEE